ncbi:uncharacterized protein LOC107467236 [Arachis duranensis]|uniref:Uncharacterized protein LOC107467236 n=1 Tax=Arachis duranensis TaxID=130453 RepID=A0A6P4BQY3_ARADU|nr:uncharacterized protein LOC107467236 [Arachis duranensis]
MLGTDEFEIEQQFNTKEEAVLTVKGYNIRRGIEYKVFEFDQLKYYGKCVQFKNGCNWLIRVTMRQRKGYWEVRNLGKGVAQRGLVKFGFKPSYRKVWMAKQKAVAHIYGDLEEFYNHIPRWIIEVQLYLPSTIAMLRTSQVRAGNTVDGARVFFHRLFWMFPPCVEAFKYFKPLISIDGTHLYGKYGGTLLMAIAQDGNSNILPVAFGLVEGENPGTRLVRKKRS